jgi:hypothetical protein
MQTLTTVLLLGLSLLPQQTPTGVSPDGGRVSVSQAWNSLPDFVCKERIVSSTVEKGKTKEQRVLESIFMAQRKTQTHADGVPVHSIVESRELTAIDGKRAKDAKVPSAPLLFDGLAANILFVADVPGQRISRIEGLDGRLTIRIGFTTRKSREFLQLEFPAAVGGVQIDSQSTKTLHVESRFGALHGGSGVPVSADFQSVDIDGRAYWLPRLMKAEAVIAKDTTATYTAEYTDCKKFEVTVQIRPVTDAPPPQ